ncbi:MAG: cupredoxin domain-containing protein [Candidatus Bipolaricaulota bacterium]|nr:cupredoxin domain-containing protein [Candidatus Bipolaricaulota bacterium]MCS7273851.1 cupredoxin domain-containing protein [Candidatus Bipolaricaulota bacterium]MDW8110731.1 cupredoxin domain-containing protein [Candidatus Bipolaricaulota bacterium]MDW8328411.1 cupredoxin domain-containing protein [Candidatus Bipolaricaulota bacterium]
MRRTLVGLAFFALVMGTVYSQDDAQQPMPPGLRAISVTVDGQYIWLPSTIILYAGETVRLRIENQDQLTPEGHGFAMPGLLPAPIALRPGEVREIEFTPERPGVYRYFCHLHGEFHLSGQVLVLSR